MSEFDRERLRTHARTRALFVAGTDWVLDRRTQRVERAIRRELDRPPTDVQGIIVTGVTGGD